MRLEISCDSLDNLDVDYYKKVRLVMVNPTKEFIQELEPKDIIEHQDAKELLEAINLAYDDGFIMDWLMSKGSM